MYVTFRLGALALAIPAAAVDEIVPATGVRRLPGMAPAVAGVMLSGGGVLGIVDLALLAGSTPTDERAVVVLAGAPRLGLLVESPDAVPGGTDEAAAELTDAPLPLQGALRCAESRFHRLDLEKLRRRLRALPAGRRQRGGEDGDPDSGSR
jgi:chemotaxis signal transduction protein